MLPPPRGPREAKQRHVDAERAKRAKALLKQCSSILSSMCAVMKNAHAIYFAKPVDSVQLQIPDYPSIVTNPMDYSTVASKLAARKYASPWEFRADMELIYSNCALYNKKESVVGQAGIAAAAAFDAAWKKYSMDMRLDDEVLLRHIEDVDIAAMPEEAETFETFVPPLPVPGCQPYCLVRICDASVGSSAKNQPVAQRVHLAGAHQRVHAGAARRAPCVAGGLSVSGQGLGVVFSVSASLYSGLTRRCAGVQPKGRHQH